MEFQKSSRDNSDLIQRILVGVMIVVVLASSGFAYFVYRTYSEAFESAPPATVANRVAVKGSSPKHEAESAARAEWGQLGDYFGGTLNPIFGFVSTIALLLTIVFQARELKLSTTELKNSATALRLQNSSIQRQSFEQTMFAWIATYRQLLQEISDHQRKVTGRQALMFWWEESISSKRIADIVATRSHAQRDQDDSSYHQMNHDIHELIGSVDAKTLSDKGLEDIAEFAIFEYQGLYKSRTVEYQLDSLFRNLYRLFLWIDSQDSKSVTPAQKWLYASIVRSQLSWIELVFLFYNGQTARGKNFRSLIEKYALFDNLAFDSDAVLSLIRAHPLHERRYAPSAYDSSLARKSIGLPESAEETLALAETKEI